MAVRLKDIAKEMGVSVVTVSKVLRGQPDIGEETRNRILQRMQELNYQPNMVARGLVTGRTYTVGLVVPDLVQPYFAELARSLGGVLREAGRALLLASSEGDPMVEAGEVRTLLQRGVDVLLVASCRPDTWTEEPRAIRDVPCILLDRNVPALGASFVGMDDFEAGRLAAEHLLALGRTQIAHIAARDTQPARERLRGYRAALRGAGAAERVLVTDGLEAQGERAGYEAMRSLLRETPRPDAVFCYSDITALGAMQAAEEAGLAIPSDIAFVGCGNVSYSQYLRYPLTSIDQSVAEQGRQAAELALSLDQDRSRQARTILLQPRLIVRASTTAQAQDKRALNPCDTQS